MAMNMATQTEFTGDVGPHGTKVIRPVPSPEELAANSSDTFAIPYADPSISNGTGATVRVSLPNAELLAWGIPSLDREPGDMVPVDLTLDDNGLPQAVRLLPATLSNPEETYP